MEAGPLLLVYKTFNSKAFGSKPSSLWRWLFVCRSMSNFRSCKWLPALLTMGIIYWFSSQPSNVLPNFDWADTLIKKSGHIFEYAVLAFWCLYALGIGKNRGRLAWLLAILYSVTDEYHQSFVPGRFPSVLDVLLFDNFGALLGICLANRLVKQKRPE